jgi:4-aminobutyrate aminotransferase-like enzyme
VANWESINDKKIKFQERRQRIFMRGVKIGAKKGSGSMFGMSVFEMKDKKKATDPSAAQKINEDAVKSGLSDESLGLTSE